jgi:hypothetical protein
MSKNYYIETKGNYSLHVEEWCDGVTKVTKKGSDESLDDRDLFEELVIKEEEIAELKDELKASEARNA